MAEAHNAIAMYEEHKRGVQLISSEDGIQISFMIPPPKKLRKMCLRYVFHLKRIFLRGLYPASPAVVTGLLTLLIAVVLASDSDSWWRQNTLSYLVWDYGGKLIPQFLPHSVKLAILVAYTVGFALTFLNLLHRCVMRILLSYRGFLYLQPKEKSTFMMVWGACLTVLNGRNPLTYAFQNALPRLPVPDLKETCERYLESVEPLLTESEMTETKKLTEDFLSGVGPKLQRYLHFKSWISSNYVTDWWEQYVYLKGRTSLMINSNYYGLQSAYHTPTHVRASRAACLIHEILGFKTDLEREQLPPQLIRGIIPVCMQQYTRMFSTTRVPGREIDTIVQYSVNESRHIVVLCNGRWYKLNVYHSNGHGDLLSAYEIQEQLNVIEKSNESISSPLIEEEGKLAGLTSDGRIAWAENREKYFSEGTNKASLKAIESAIFVLVLDDNKPETWSEAGSLLLHGVGGDRWFDKSFNLVVFKNGFSGINAEHSWADAPVIAHMWEHAIASELALDLYDRTTKTILPPSEKKTFTNSPPKLLQWDFSGLRGEHLTKAIQEALVNTREAIDDFDLNVSAHHSFGKGFIKKQKCSPDAFVQLALQLAYYKNAGCFTQTYEASMTRLYKEGRTETVRPVTSASKRFVLAMMDPNKQNSEKIQCLRDAAESHRLMYCNAMSGKGIDRHLFTLYCVAVGMGIESPFLKDALARPWRLSTSQQPQNQTPHWKGIEKVLTKQNLSLKEVFSPGGGFGPVAPDGYGVSYMFGGDEQFCFHVSSKKSASTTSSTKFTEDLYDALGMMKKIFEE